MYPKRTKPDKTDSKIRSKGVKGFRNINNERPNRYEAIKTRIHFAKVEKIKYIADHRGQLKGSIWKAERTISVERGNLLKKAPNKKN